MHEELYPKPSRRQVKRSWQFWLGAAVVASLAVLAALRTAYSFYTAAELSSQLYGTEAGLQTAIMSYGEMFVAVLGVEGGIIWASIEHARRSKKVSPRTYRWYIGMLLSISIVAGVGQSLGLVGTLPAFVLESFTWVMAVVLGVFTSVAAFLAGEMFGGKLLSFSEEQDAAGKEFERWERKWLSDARKRWFEVRNDEPAPLPQSEDIQINHSPEQAGGSVQDAHKRKIRAYLSKTIMDEDRIPPASEISKAVGLEVAYVQRMISEMRTINIVPAEGEETSKSGW